MQSKIARAGIAAALAAFIAVPAFAQSQPAAKDEVRASKLIGSTVYNEQDQSVGTLDDILVTHDTKQPVQAVISVGGFLGIGSKLVEVPYDRLSLRENNKVVMPSASRDDLKNMPSFSYNTLEHAGSTNAGSSSSSTPSTAGTSSGTGMGTATGLGTGSRGDTSTGTGTGTGSTNR